MAQSWHNFLFSCFYGYGPNVAVLSQIISHWPVSVPFGAALGEGGWDGGGVEFNSL